MISRFEARIGRQVLGNVAASGTEILKRLGTEHIATGKPIVYTSADSVFQISAHEAVIPLSKLYAMCKAAREMLAAPLDILRVIARPFVGDSPETFRRTDNRRDYPLRPPHENVLQALVDAGLRSQAIGVIADLFPRDLFSAAERTQNNPAHLAAILHAIQTPREDFIFANCEDFDMLYGHRNDPIGFAAALEAFDTALGSIIAALRTDDLLLLTADHGNDPTTASTDHSREYVPLLTLGAGLPSNCNLGTRSTFADIGATVSDWLNVPWLGPGKSVLRHLSQGL